MSRPTTRGRKVVTVYVYPAIPVRDMDWMAHFEGDEEGPTGRGETEADALRDLAEQLDVKADFQDDQRNTLSRAAGKAKSRRFSAEPEMHSAFGSFA